MDSTSTLYAVVSAKKLWNEGQSIVETALMQVKKGREPDADEIQELSETCSELRKQVRQFENLVPGLVHATWIPWRAGKTSFIESGHDLCEICRLLAKHRLPIPWQEIAAWAKDIRGDFDTLSRELKTGSDDDELTKEEKALGMLAGNPQIKKAEIARNLKIDVRSLGIDRMPTFGIAWNSATAKEGTPGLISADGSVDVVHFDDEPDLDADSPDI